MTRTRRTTAKKPATRRARTAGAVDSNFAPVAAVFAGDRRVSRRKMFSSNSVLSVDGKIFAMLARGTFVAKLPKDRVDALVRAGAGERFDPGHGRLMKEWIAVGTGRADWIALAKEAYRFVREGRSGP
jgi:hypothetical protein